MLISSFVSQDTGSGGSQPNTLPNCFRSGGSASFQNPGEPLFSRKTMFDSTAPSSRTETPMKQDTMFSSYEAPLFARENSGRIEKQQLRCSGRRSCRGRYLSAPVTIFRLVCWYASSWWAPPHYVKLIDVHIAAISSFLIQPWSSLSSKSWMQASSGLLEWMWQNLGQNMLWRWNFLVSAPLTFRWRWTMTGVKCYFMVCIFLDVCYGSKQGGPLFLVAI